MANINNISEFVKKGKDSVAAFAHMKSITTSFMGAVALLGSLWAIDTHYASAEDVNKVQREVNSQIYQLRVEKIEDELFRLDMKKQQQNGKLDPMDAALYERYTRKLREHHDAQPITVTK